MSLRKANVYDMAESVLHNTRGLKFLYISASHDNLHRLHTHCLNTVDLSTTTTLIYFTLPDGIRHLDTNTRFSGVWIDKDAISDLDYEELVRPLNDGWAEIIDPETQEIL